jgi:Ca2+-binding RTX toxin-like protein
MARYTETQFLPGTNVYYSFGVHPLFAEYDGHVVAGIDSATYRNKATNALEIWDDNLNFNFVYTSNPLYADLTINWALIDGRSGILGFQAAIDPNGNGIVSGPNEGLSVIFMDIEDFRTFDATIRHEVGHAIGLGHDESRDDLMNSRLSGSETITAYDVSKAAELYGYNATGSGASENFTGSRLGDRYSGRSGNDTISGGSGSDILYGNHGLDRIDGGSGNDVLFGGQNEGAFTGAPGAQRDGTEFLWGGSGSDILYGNYGTDVLMGGTGSDTLFGGQDDDGLQGGYGDDILYGNAGADAFYYNFFGEGNEGHDTIIDFSPDQGDELNLTNADIASTTSSFSGLSVTLTTGTKISIIGVFDISEISYVSV